MKKKMLSALIAAVMVLAMSATAFADSLSVNDALNKALKNAKLTKSKVKHIEKDYDREDNVFEIEFVKKSNKAEYDYEIAADTGKIIKRSIDYKLKRNTSKKKIGKTKARKIAAKKAGVKLSVVKKGTCRYEYDDRKGTYEVKFTSGGKRNEIEILAPNGKIDEYEWQLAGVN